MHAQRPAIYHSLDNFSPLKHVRLEVDGILGSQGRTLAVPEGGVADGQLEETGGVGGAGGV